MRTEHILALAGVFALSTMGDAMATEEPEYRVLQTFPIEIREYGAQLVAETDVDAELEDAGNQGFRRLASYIFGKNERSTKIAMTAPVSQRASEKIAMTAPVTIVRGGAGTYRVRFTMTAGYTQQTLPVPTDANVHISEQPARRVAVIRYSGTWSRKNYETHLAELRAALTAAHLQADGEPTWARYDPPWIPWFLRRNEIMLDLNTP